MKNVIFIFITAVFCVALSIAPSSRTLAEEAASPHATPPSGLSMPMAAGRIEGTLVARDKAGTQIPLTSHPMTLVISRDGVPVLRLDKRSDAEGKFTVKNVFSDPAFAYALETRYEDRGYVLSQLRLEEGKDLLTVSFQVGEGSPYASETAGPRMASPSAMPPPMPTVMPPSKAPSSEITPVSQDSLFKTEVIVLCVLVAGVALYYYRSERRRPRG